MRLGLAGPHLLAKARVLLALQHDVEGLQDRKTGAHERQQLLIKEEEPLHGDDFARAGKEIPKGRHSALGRENVHSLTAQLLFGRSGRRGLDMALEDLAVGGTDPDDKFRHALVLSVFFDGRREVNVSDY